MWKKIRFMNPMGKSQSEKRFLFGLQHVLAMFVANIAPILIVAGAVKMDPAESAALVQSVMIVAGIGSLLQLFPIWRFGSGLPIIMGISFTFVSVACIIGTKYGYGAVLGAALICGILEGILGLGASWWRKFIPPIVFASVVTAIGFSLLPIGANSFGGGFGNPNFGAQNYLIVGTITLVACLAWNLKAHSFYKQLFRPLRACRWLYRRVLLRHGRSVSSDGSPAHFPSRDHADFFGIPWRCDFLLLPDFPRLGNRNARGYQCSCHEGIRPSGDEP